MFCREKMSVIYSNYSPPVIPAEPAPAGIAGGLPASSCHGWAWCSPVVSLDGTGPVSTHLQGPGLRCAGLRLTAAWSMPGGIQGIQQLQRNITLRYIQAT